MEIIGYAVLILFLALLVVAAWAYITRYGDEPKPDAKKWKAAFIAEIIRSGGTQATAEVGVNRYMRDNPDWSTKDPVQAARDDFKAWQDGDS